MTEPVRTCWICREKPATEGVIALPPSLCATCAGTVARPYAEAWETLSRYLQKNWQDIVRRGSFDLSQPFGGAAASGALAIHLYFVALLGSKLDADHIHVDLTSFATALIKRCVHPEITLLVASCAVQGKELLYYDAAVSLLKRDDEVYSAVWMNLYTPVAVKVCYLKRGAPVLEPEGFPWHPTRQRKLVKLSPFKGDTRSTHARRDLRM